MVQRIIDAIFETIAKGIQPFIDNEELSLDELRKGIGLSERAQLEKTHEALVIFERARMETAWDVEKCFLLIDDLTTMKTNFESDRERVREKISKVPKAEQKELIDEEVALTKEIDQMTEKIEKWTNSLAESQDKIAQQDAYITLLRTRCKSKKKDLVNLKFKDTDAIRGIKKRR